MRKRIGQQVRILGGMAEFVGELGEIVDYEGDGMYRVELSRPVFIEGIGEVHDDLWNGPMLRTVRTLTAKDHAHNFER